jgi:Skp family chaperone for outer membrane proteins|tara:strand:- start:28 stop:585 length:558 start_codon:yes stop_codon:yes gene_type:complete
MKRLGVPSIIMALLLSAFFPAALQADVKIGYIDSEILRERMPEFQQIQREIERLRAQYEQEALDRQSKLVKLQEDFQKQELLLSEAKKTQMQVEFEEAVQQLQEFTQDKLGPNGELIRKNIELSSPIFEKVNAALEELAQAESYDFIFDVASNGAIVYADPERYNLTESLLEKLEEAREAQEAGQ